MIISHLPSIGASKLPRSQALQEMELSISEHFRKQNEMLMNNNCKLNEQLKRLTNGVECLAKEMHGFRTGKSEEAFARVAGVDASPDLPTVSAEAALIYTLTAAQIGAELGFHSSQIGLLLSPKGLGWAGNGDYQEIGRTINPSHSKFWRREVPARLCVVLDEGRPEKLNIKAKAVLTIFRKWGERRFNCELLAMLESTTPTH